MSSSSYGIESLQYARRRFGEGPTRLLALLFCNLREMRKIEESIMQGSDDSVMKFKTSHLSAVGTTSVAVC